MIAQMPPSNKRCLVYCGEGICDCGIDMEDLFAATFEDIFGATHRRRKPMEEYQERAIEEQRELNERLVRLIRFTTTDTYRKLDREDRELLTSQQHAMIHYNDVLSQRIARFNRGDSDGG